MNGAGLRPPVRGAWTMLAWVVLLACGVNVLLFAWHGSIPLPANDAWYFLAAFVAPALDGTLELRDFFVQRDGGDHAQPLQKLVLLAHLHAADLDFRVEGAVGALAAIGTVAMLVAMVLAGAVTPRQQRVAACGAACIALVGLSLNATGIYTWSLVTLGWMLVTVTVLYWVLLCRPARLAWAQVAIAAFATFAMALMLDELAFPVVIALLMAKALHDRRAAASLAGLADTAGMVAGLLAARWAISRLSPVGDVAASSLQAALARIESWDDIATVVGAPLADALVHASHWSPGTAGQWLAGLLMALLLVAHAAYWWRVLVSRALPSRLPAVVSIALMLLSYATVAGVLMARIAQHGVDYVHQPRYVLFYQLGVVAWMMMFLAPRANAGQAGGDAPGRRIEVACLSLFATVLSLQVWLSVQAWQSQRHLEAYVLESAATMEDLAAQPRSLPEDGCPDILSVCEFPAPDREAALALLAGHQLNLFSARFRKRHGLALANDPQAEGSLTPGERAACAAAFQQWGPTEIPADQAFNRQPNGLSAYWVRLTPGLPRFRLSAGEGGRRITHQREADVVTFFHGPALQAVADSGGPVRIALACIGGPTTVIEIPVVPSRPSAPG